MKHTHIKKTVAATAFALLALAALPSPLRASSHMDAPLITLDPSANTTDVYAFLHSENGSKVLETALAVYPFEEPGIGPNKYNFDDNVLYEIHVSTGADLAAGQPTISYQFRFTTTFKNQATILQSYLGVIQNVDDANQNLTQRYTVTKVVRKTNTSTVLGSGVVPPNNQGIATPRYEVGDKGENAARPGVSSPAALDAYTAQTIASLTGGYRAFAGQREDGFYADVQAVFDLLQFRTGKTTFDSQAGFNVHTMALEIPLSELGSDQQIVGVYATTSRQSTTVLTDGTNSAAPTLSGPFRQVGRQGNPLFNEGLVAIQDKDLYSRTQPSADASLFQKYASTPELAKLINTIVFKSTVAPETNRTDLVGIFIPDLIKVDLSTAPARLAGGGADFAANPDDAGFSRLGIFGGDVLTSTVQPGFGGKGTVPGGWPNGRRFGDDVLDIAVTAIISDLRDPNNPTIRSADGIDNVSKNDSVYNKVFPYAGTPHNGRNHEHHSIAGTVTDNRFKNIATRGPVQTGDNVLIGGIIIGGNVNKRIIVRGIGPSLPSSVPNPLQDPVIEIYQGSTKIASNDNWKDTDQANITATGLAPTRDAESAIIVTLAPGDYTMVLRGTKNSTGNALVEAYDLD
ncbi:MAG: hypothetical protein DLM73_06675 [Chthoniobacterales bacterium]|nr:MAG: hypothetical protein DLM73_06675 [Chthoniobacterales bacterium]